MEDEMEHDEFSKIELRTMVSAWRALNHRWDLSPRERRALLPEGGEEDTSPPRDTETRMRVLIAVGYRIGMPEDMLHDWLRTPTKTLGWLTPLDAMSGSLGELRGVRRLVEEGFAL
jgi:hypothetical protein